MKRPQRRCNPLANTITYTDFTCVLSDYLRKVVR